VADDRGSYDVKGWEFEQLIRWLLPLALGTDQAHLPTENDGGGADFLARVGDRCILVEIKFATPQTLSRAEALAQQVAEFRKRYESRGPAEAVVAVPGVVSPRFAQPFVQRGIQIWDKHKLLELLSGHRGDRMPVAAERAAARLLAHQPSTDPEPTISLMDRLGTMRCGHKHAYHYQRLCEEILGFLFCPALDNPITERRNESGINRRDIILPNYATDGFWRFVREAYRADFIVIDAKNLCGGVKKKDVLQLAHYLTEHGTGLFGILVTRTSSERSAEIVRREQWVLHRKLIVVLNDDDLRQMLETNVAGDSPEAAIRQKIEAFRLGF
jgi:hypothetical protein